MNPLLIGTLVAGALVGLGVYLLIASLVTERVSLTDAVGLDRSITHMSVLEQESTTSAAAAGWATKWAAKAEVKLNSWRLTTPDADLALIEWTRGRFLLARVALTGLAVLVGPAMWGMLALAGAPLAYSVPQGMSLLLGLFVWYAVGLWVKGQAAARRLEMREALVSYLTLLALYKASGDGMVGALQQAATDSDAWTFRRIDARLAASVRAGGSPQGGLRRLGDELGIGELGDVADIAATAGLEGAGVFTTLLARANALRNQMQTDAEANAAANSVRLGVPKALLVATGVAFMMYPLITSISGA